MNHEDRFILNLPIYLSPSRARIILVNNLISMYKLLILYNAKIKNNKYVEAIGH